MKINMDRVRQISNEANNPANTINMAKVNEHYAKKAAKKPVTSSELALRNTDREAFDVSARERYAARTDTKAVPQAPAKSAKSQLRDTKRDIGDYEKESSRALADDLSMYKTIYHSSELKNPDEWLEAQDLSEMQKLKIRNSVAVSADETINKDTAYLENKKKKSSLEAQIAAGDWEEQYGEYMSLLEGADEASMASDNSDTLTEYINNPSGEANMLDEYIRIYNDPVLKDKEAWLANLDVDDATKEQIKAADVTPKYNYSSEHFTNERLGNINAANAPISLMSGMVSGEGMERYTLLTEEERKVYNVLYNTQGIKAADEFLDFMWDELGRRESEQSEARWEKFADKVPVLSSIASVPLNIVGGVLSGADLALQGLDKLASGASVDTNTATQRFGSGAETIRSTVSQNIAEAAPFEIHGQNVASLLYNTLMSGIDSAVTGGVGGALGKTPKAAGRIAGAILSGGAGSSAARDIARRGGSDSQVLIGGMAAGLIEAIFESVSIENFHTLKQTTPETVKAIWANRAKSVVTNFSEEFNTELANQITDTLLMGDISNWELTIKDYMAQGMSESEAKRAAAKDFGVQLLAAGASGAIMGGVFGAGTDVRNYKQYQREQADISAAQSLRATLADENLLSAALEASQNESAASETRNSGEPETLASAALESVRNERVADGVETNAETQKIEAQQRASTREKVLGIAKEALGEQGYKTFESALREENDPVKYYSELTRAYNDGMTGKKSGSPLLTSGQYEAMYAAGQKDAETSLQSQLKTATNVISYGAKDGGIDYSDVATKEYVESAWDKRTRKAIDTTAKALGIKVRVAGSVAGGDANAQLENGVVTIEKGNPNPLRFLFGHEITHRMQELAPAEYTKLRSAVLSGMTDVDARVKAIQANYAKHSRSIASEAALDEIVADKVGELLESDGALESFIRRNKNDRTLLEKLRDIVKDLAVKLAGSSKAKRLQQVEKRLNEALGAATKQAQANATKNAAQTSDGKAKYSINKLFASDISEWDKNGRPEGEHFVLGSTGPVLQGLGAIESDVYMTGYKVNKILSDHPEMTLAEIKKIPQMLEDPVLILSSKGVGKRGKNTRLVVFGAVKAQNGQPVMAVLDLRPVENHLVVDDMQKVNSAYTKDNPVDFVAASYILHADKKRTIPLLRTMGLHLRPIDLLRSGSVGSITYKGDSVNIFGVPFNTVINEQKTGGSGDGKLSLKDSDYLAAVNRGDMETAQKMVDEAAKAEGYQYHLYHGTNADFTKFDVRKHGGAHGKGEGYGIYLAANREISAAYGENVIDSYTKFNRLAEGRKKTLSYAEVKKLVKQSCELEAKNAVVDGEADSVAEALRDTWVSNYVYTYEYSSMSQVYADVVDMLWEGNDNDGDLINEIMTASGAHYDYNNALNFYNNLLTPVTGIDGFHYVWGNKDGSGKQNDIYLAFNSEQIKSADPVTYDDNGNVIPLSERFNEKNDDIRFSLKGSRELVAEIDRIRSEGEKQGRSEADIQKDVYAAVNEVYQGMLTDYGAIAPGEKPAREVQVPKRTADNKKVSQTIRTVMEAGATPDAALPKIEEMIAKGEFSYEVYGDEEALGDAREYIQNKGWESARDDWFAQVRKGNVTKRNTATGWLLYDNAVNEGNVELAMNILNAMVEHQRNAAQALQATRLLKKMSPETQLYGIQRSIANLQQEINDKYKKKRGAVELKIDEELAQEFIEAKTQEERDEVTKKIYKDIGRQLPSTFADKFRAWRYLAMLGNFRTHVRNIGGNAFFIFPVAAKNLAATGIENAVYYLSGKRTQRTKSLALSKELLSAAWGDYNNVADVISGNGKYGEAVNTNRYIDEGRVIFKNSGTWGKKANSNVVAKTVRKASDLAWKPVEKVRVKNSAAMEKEDMWFSKPHYTFALAQYCKANGITAEQIKSGKGLDKARAYAIKEAQKATYRDTNALSHHLSKRINENGEFQKAAKIANTVVEGILPFRKTPANILARGIEYSPIGLLNGLKQALWDVRRGTKTSAEAIDSISAGLTGSGLMRLGLFLAAQGLVRGRGGDDEDKRKFEEMMGHQKYSLELSDGTSVTLDWLAPEALPFFVGVNLYEMTKENKEDVKLKDVLTAVGTVTEPMLELSCLQSLNDIFESVGYASNNDMSGLMSALSSAATSYLTQALPTILGQGERSGEPERMTTYTDKNSQLTNDMQYTLGKASARLPGVDYQQIPYIDAWGRAESGGEVGERSFNNFLNPAYTSSINTSAMEEELLRLYEATGESSVFPSRADKHFTVDKERKDLTAEEYVKYATKKGQTAYDLMTALVENSSYKSANDEDKAEMVKEVYQYANAVAKMEVSDYKPDGWVAKAISAGEKTGIKADRYVVLYLAQKDIGSLKDAKGDTITNSHSLMVMQMIYNTSGLTEKQRQALFEAFDVSASIRHYNKSLVEEKLKKMKKQAG